MRMRIVGSCLLSSTAIWLLAAGCQDSPNPTKTNAEQERVRLAIADPASTPVDAAPPISKVAPPTRPLVTGANSVVVDDDGVDCPNPDFFTIQAAVNSGAKQIRVCAGTYSENVTIGPGADVKLRGDGVGTTMVTGVAGTAGPIIDVLASSKVHISDLTVDGGSVMAGGVVWGIRYDESDGLVDNVEVLNIRNTSGSSQGLGIRVQSSGQRAKVKVTRTLVQNYTRVGINGNGMGVDFEVSKNVIDGPVLPRVWAPNGIQISRGAEGNVMQNSVDNNPSPNPPGGAGSGIILFCAGPTNVHKNVVTDADLGIAIADNDGAHVHNNEIYDSVFDGISLQFIGLFFGPLGCTPSPTPAQNNVVHNNKISNSGDTGISLANFDPGSDPATPNDNRVHNNNVDGSTGDGIRVFADPLGAGDNPSNNELKNNRITNSGSTDSVDDTSGSGTEGTANTWKNNKCSTSSPAGLCK